MAIKVFMLNNENNTFEEYFLELTDTMPYATPGSLTVGEFQGSSNSPTIWSMRTLMECWNRLREDFGSPIGVRYAFKRIWQGGHGTQSQHYAGTAMDMAQGLTNDQRTRIRNLASDLGCFGYVEPAYLTPTWVHVDSRIGPPACSAGYPEVKVGSINTYVFVLQDALNTLGFIGAGLDGVFGSDTERLVKQYQEARGLPQTGVVACQTWTTLTTEVKGIGASDTTIL